MKEGEQCILPANSFPAASFEDLMNSEKSLRLHRVSKCSWSCLAILMLLHKRFVSLPLSHFPHVLESCRSAALLRPKAIMQSPYAMHVQARWRDTCHSQICDDSLEWGRWRKIDGRSKKNQSVYTTCTGIIWTMWSAEGKLDLQNCDMLQLCTVSLLQAFLFKKCLNETMHVEKGESCSDMGLSRG